MKGIRLVGLVLMMVFVFGVPASASADESGPGTMTPEAAQKALEEGERVESQLTDSKAAEQLPHHDLERAQVLQLISEVFGSQIEGVAGVFNDLDVDHFLSDNAAVIDAGDQPEASGAVIGDGNYEGPALLESTVPLRTEDQSGEEATVDLGLEHAEGEIQPATPLVEVGIPSELGEGIELPESEVQIALDGAPAERSPSIVNQTVAVYPEVADDTSFAVAPSPTGVETFTLLQSPDAPNSATYQLSLPEGASLTATDDGGAEVSTGGQSMLRIFPPAAMDAEGNEVPVSLEVSGNSFTVHAEPQEGAAYPILLDPVIESHNWNGYSNPEGLAAWQGTSNDQGLLANKQSAEGHPGTDLRAVKGFGLAKNAQAQWAYSVPRYESDQKEFGAPPTSYISSMVLSTLFFVSNDKSAYPWMAAGIWDPSVANWASAWAHAGNTGNLENLATTYTFNTTNQNAKQAIDNELWAGEAHTMTSDRESYVGTATVEIADAVAPKIGSLVPPEGWVDNTAPTIPYSATDTGLGIKEMTIGRVGGDQPIKWTNSLTCSGTVSFPCPRSWKSENYPLQYVPSSLPQGINKMAATATDPTGNTSAPYEFTLKVDHTAPSLTLSGTMTQQASLGYKRPQYVLHLEGSDGSATSPQAGIASSEITVDGKAVDSTKAGCATQNCTLSRDWTLKSSAYTVGEHKVVATVTDGAGITTTKSLTIKIEKDTTAPVLNSWGTLRTAPEGWVEQINRGIAASAVDGAGYGVTSLAFSIDGKVVKSASQSCVSGGCESKWEAAVNMATYAGGAHSAEVVATDGAGNVSKDAWTVNVDPSGAVSAAEAVDTLEAVEETTEAAPVAPSAEVIDPAEVEAGNNPALKAGEGKLTSTGTGATTVMTTDPKAGLTIESGEGNIVITPVGGAGTTTSEVVSNVAAVSGGSGVDTITRPIYDGDQTFKTIRDETAPETYSWKVSLNKGQTLKAIDSEHVSIFNSDESQALAITVEAAHDATGKAVPTSLSVSEGNVLTLTVKYKGKGFTYPIIGGPAFQSSYTLPVIWEPAPLTEEPKTEEQWYQLLNGQLPIIANISAPQAVGCPGEGEACASSSGYIKTYGFTECIVIPLLNECANAYKQKIRGFFYFNFNEAWMSKRQPNCETSGSPTITVEDEYCKWVGPDHQKYGAGYHITSQVKFRLVSQPKAVAGNWKYVTVRMFGSGNAYAHQTSAICNPSRPDC